MASMDIWGGKEKEGRMRKEKMMKEEQKEEEKKEKKKEKKKVVSRATAPAKNISSTFWKIEKKIILL